MPLGCLFSYLYHRDICIDYVATLQVLAFKQAAIAAYPHAFHAPARMRLRGSEGGRLTLLYADGKTVGENAGAALVDGLGIVVQAVGAVGAGTGAGDGDDCDGDGEVVGNDAICLVVRQYFPDTLVLGERVEVLLHTTDTLGSVRTVLAALAVAGAGAGVEADVDRVGAGVGAGAGAGAGAGTGEVSSCSIPGSGSEPKLELGLGLVPPCAIAVGKPFTWQFQNPESLRSLKWIHSPTTAAAAAAATASTKSDRAGAGEVAGVDGAGVDDEGDAPADDKTIAMFRLSSGDALVRSVLWILPLRPLIPLPCGGGRRLYHSNQCIPL
jgi:hypothetical protein